MRQLSHLLCIVTALSVAVCLQQKALAQTNLTTIKSQGSGSYWSQAIWATNAPGTFANTTPLVMPVAGNTYEEVQGGNPSYAFGANNTRLRNPTGEAGTSQTFPGDSLQLDTNTEIRLKDVSGLT